MSWCETCKKYVPLVKQNAMKLEVFILGGQKIQKRWWRGRRERIEKGRRERIEIERKETLRKQFEEEDKEHRHLNLLVVHTRHCVSPELPTRFCSKEV